MTNLNQWTKEFNYIGEDFSEYFVGPVRSRDSDLVAQSNFECALEQLGGETETVQVARFSHWAVGWIEQILVHTSDKKSVKILQNIDKAIANYPLLNEDNYYQMESDELDSDFDFYQTEFTKNAIADLVQATDVPESILELLHNSNAFEIMLREIHRESSAYAGIENAFISKGTFLKHFKNVDSNHWANSDVQSFSDQIKIALGE